MKKIFILTAVVFVTVSSCRKDVASIAARQSNQATPVASNSQSAIPFSDVFVAHHDGTQLFNPCTNEVMTIYGDVQFRVHGVTNKNNSMTITNSSA